MSTKFNMIQSAQETSDNYDDIHSNFSILAEQLGENKTELMESATYVLAGIRSLISKRRPLTSTGLSAASVAGVVSGIDVLLKTFPSLNPAKQERIAGILGKLELGSNMTLNAVQGIANLAEKNPDRDHIRQLFVDYEDGNHENDEELIDMLGRLHQHVDRALRIGVSNQHSETV